MVIICFCSENIRIFVTLHHIERILHERSFNMKIAKQIFDMFLKLCILYSCMCDSVYPMTCLAEDSHEISSLIFFEKQ